MKYLTSVAVPDPLRPTALEHLAVPSDKIILSHGGFTIIIIIRQSFTSDIKCLL